MNNGDIEKVLGKDGINIVYLNENKERTDAWFQAGGQHFRAPLGGSKFGSVRRLSYAAEKSNTTGAEDTKTSTNDPASDVTPFDKQKYFNEAKDLNPPSYS